MTVTGKNTLTLSDVLVGDVWLCSGQSNMTYRLAFDEAYHAAEIAAAHDPDLRCFTVVSSTAPSPLADLQPNGYQRWDLANPDTVAHDFTAVGYYFGLELRRRLGPGVPIGLIRASYGGTPAEPWVSREGLSKDPGLKAMADAQIANMVRYPDNLKVFAANVAAGETRYSAKDTGNTGLAQGWAKPDFDDSAWKTVSVPMNFSQIGMKAGGAVWLRKSFDVPASAAGKGLYLKLNYSSDAYTPYFNGVALSGGQESPPSFSEARGFGIPGNLVHAGRNTLAVRVFSHTRDGGFSMRMSDFGLTKGPDSGAWKYAMEFANPELPADAQGAFPRAPSAVPQYTSSYIYNASIHPLIPVAMKGVSLKQFAIAGGDQKFVWADAQIDGDTVVVSSPQVPHPAAARYAFGDNPEGCNLTNGSGLPLPHGRLARHHHQQSLSKEQAERHREGCLTVRPIE